MSNFKRRIIIEQISRQSRGIYDALPTSAEDFDGKEEVEETVPKSEPIDPSPQMAVQLSVAEPPIDDPDFLPVSVEELATAASALSREVPVNEVEWYYKQLHQLVNKANDRDLAGGDDAGDSEDGVQEGLLKKVVRKALFEALSPGDDPDLDFTSEEETELDQYRTGGVDYFGDIEPEPEPEPEEPEGMSLEDLAQEFGYSGPSGVRQEINRITSRMEYFAMNIKSEDLDALLNYAVGEYIDVLADTGALDAEDLDELKAAPQLVKDLETFRFFFVTAFILPAYKEVSREAAKNLQTTIDGLELPKELNLAVLNQLSGKAKKSPATIRRKLMKLVAAGQLDTGEADAIAAKIKSAMPMLKQAAELSDDLVEKALQKWQAVSKRKKSQFLDKALDQTEGV